MTRYRHIRSVPLALIALSVLGLIALPKLITAGPESDIDRAWTKAARAGSYTFTMNIVQQTDPLPTVTNVGRQTSEQRLYLEGETNLLDSTLDLRVWNQGGTVLDPSSAVEVRSDGEGTRARTGGQAWQPVDGFTELFAPTGDLLAFTAAARDVKVLDADSSATAAYTRYSYTIDGAQYAEFIRDRLQEQLVADGQLPPGVTLDLSETYRNMEGAGELWIDKSGLPARQVIDIEFANQDDYQTTAEITVDFAEFGTAASAEHLLQTWLGTYGSVDLTPTWLPSTGIAALVLLCIALMVRGCRSRTVYRVVALTVVVSMLFTPFLTGQQVAAFNEHQAEENAAAEARAEESEAQTSLQDLDPTPKSVSDASALAAIAGDDGTDSDGDGRSDVQEAFQQTNVFDDDTELTATAASDDGTDTDGDGLTNYVESLLGTDADASDTDADQISDILEVRGFTYPNGEGGMRTWYTDVESADTNDDGLTDGEEWDSDEDGTIDDTDGDSVPDLFDDDNDGDDVPDSVDISPYTVGGTYDEDNPFSLVIDGLTAETLTYVELQARPVITDHLWYAYNVLDWPDDREGQIQDGDGATLFDVDGTTDPNPNDNGDLKMVPMLEILIEGQKTNLPSQDVLSSYGIYTITVTEDGSQLAAYVPLQVVDDEGDGRAAFYAKMLYLPGTDWGNAQQIRMVWVVQALVDICDTYTDSSCSHYSEYNQFQPVITYDDEWTLTGLSIREDHGMDMAFIYEDPAVDGDLDDDLGLYNLAYGLESTFLAGRTGSDGSRDITIQEIARRFDHTTNTGVSSEERWSIDNTLAVVSRTYSHRDAGLMTAAMTETTQVLDGHFTSYATVSPITPTVMIAREERYRATNLDTLRDSDPDFAWQGNLLRVDMTTERIPVQTVAGLSWAPYQYDLDSGAWYASSIESYWDELEHRYGNALPDESENSQSGHMLIMQVFYVGMYRGATSVVQLADYALQQNYFSTDKPLGATIATAARTAIKFVVNTIVMRGIDAALYASRIGSYAHSLAFHQVGVANPLSSLKALGTQLARYLRGLWNGGVAGIKTLGAIAIVTLAVLTVVILGLIELGKSFLAGDAGTRIAVATIVGVVLFAFTVVAPCLRIINLIQATRAITGASLSSAMATVLAGKAELAGASKVAGIIGLVLAVGITWGVFIYAVCSADMPPGSVAFNTVLAQTIAATIWVIVQFALATTVVGAIIVALIAVIDLVISLLGYEEYSISALVAKYLGEAIYHYDVLVDTDVDMAPLSVDLVKPLEGMIDGAQLRVRTVLTTTATHKDPTDVRLMVYAPAYYTQSQLRRTSFVYSLTEITTTLSTDINAMSSAWKLAYDHTWGLISMYRGTIASEAEATVTLSAGINHATNLVLNTGYALPGVECWTVPLPPFWYPVPICYPESMEDDASTLLPSATVLDVFPATIDAFAALEWAGNASFLQQRDHDGDGLISPYFGGNDPDDEKWDTDDDGLADGFELEMRQLGTANGGAAYGPLDPDTDSDGLTDWQENQAGTNPARRDSDGDLLDDTEEVYHQDLTDYDRDGDTLEWIGGWTLPLITTDIHGITSTLTVLVRSDPLVVDADGDGMGDGTEKTLATLAPETYPYLPQVWNESPVALLATINDADAIVGPGQTFIYSATVANQIALDHYILGAVTTTVPSSLVSTGPITAAFNLFRDDADTLATEVTVPTATSDITVSLGSEMFAYQHDGDVRIRWDWSPAANFTTGSTEAWPWYSAIAPNAASADLSTGNAYALATIEGNYTTDSLSVDRIGNIASSGTYLRYGTAAIGGDNEASWSTRPSGPGPVDTTPAVACAEDTGRCLTVWADDSYNSCTTVTYNDLYCHSEEDGPGSHSEFYLEVGGSSFWGVSSTATGDRETINVARSFCTSETYELWEEDDWPNGDDDYGSATFYALSPGSGSNRHSGADATVSWYVTPNYDPTVYGRLFEATGSPVTCNVTTPVAVSSDITQLKRTPVVASDGSEFLVVWDHNSTLWVNRFANDCGVVTPYQLASAGSSSTNPALAWAGDRYLLVWEKATSSGATADISLAQISQNGTHLTTETIAATPMDETIPAVAYDTETGRALIVYTASGNTIWGRFWQAGVLQTPFEIATADRISSLDVAYEPTHGDWVVMWTSIAAGETGTITYLPLAADGTRLLSAKDTTTDPDSDLIGVASAPYDEPSSTSIACRTEVPDPVAGECGIVVNPPTPDTTTDPQSIALAKVGLLEVLPWVGTYNLSNSVSVIVDASGPDATISGLRNGQYLTSTHALVIGGDAHDSTNVDTVHVSIDGGPWQAATGTESWAYSWDMQGIADGAHTIRVYAADVAGNDGNVTGITVVVDGTPPTATADIASGAVLGAMQDTDGRWRIALTGDVTDPTAGALPGSGAANVSVLVAPNSSGWQTATVSATAWAIEYSLTAFDTEGNAIADPSGTYTLTLRTVDNMANVTADSTATQVRFYVDTTPPDTALTYPASTDNTISDGTLSFTGVVTDPVPPQQVANVNTVEIAIVPSGEQPDDHWQSATVTSPGQPNSSWSAPIGTELEGLYEVNLRGADTLGNRNDLRSSWFKWQGEIDTMAPRAVVTITYRGAGRAAQTVVSGSAQDDNLTLEGLEFLCTIRAGDRSYYSSSWWDDVVGVETRLTQITPSCIVRGHITDTVALRVSDRYGHTAVVSSTAGAVTGQAAALPPLQASAVVTPLHETILGTLDPADLTVGTYALAGLRALTMTINGVLYAANTWPVSPTITDTLWTTALTPTAEGLYEIVTVVEDHDGIVQTDLQPIELTVDTQPPTVGISTLVLTTTHQLSLGRAQITGTVSDTVGLEAVEVATDTLQWDDAHFGDGSWSYPLSFGYDPDGEPHTINVRASDGARTVQISQTVTVDLDPPDPVTVTLTYDAGSGPQALVAGDTVRDADPQLGIAWTSSSDGSGAVAYYVGWSADPEPDLTTLTRYDSAATHAQIVGEPQAVYAHVVAVDPYGNQQVETIGPVTVDAAETPDYIQDLSYYGWLSSGCTLLGADYGILNHAGEDSTQSVAQRLYGTWDDTALRLTWTGANWDRDGDLFIYLDTMTGGTAGLYDPFGTGASATLPDGMLADFVVWIADSDTAQLMAWSGSNWSAVTWPTGAAFRQNTSLLPTHTDILLPRAALGNPTAVTLIALATEDDTLRWWATVPDKNPLNSPLVINPVALDSLGAPFTLQQSLNLSSLSSGVCPADGNGIDANLSIDLTASPAGIELGYLEHDLPALLDLSTELDTDFDGTPDETLPVDLASAMVGNGHTITYTLSYHNDGENVAPGVSIDLTAYGALSLEGGTGLTLSLGDIAAGASDEVTVIGHIVAPSSEKSAELDAVVSDAVHGTYDRLWVLHRVDTAAPEDLAIGSPDPYAMAASILIEGSVRDPSGVPLVEIQVRDGADQVVTGLSCPDATPADGAWSCAWDLSGATDGTAYYLSVRATDLWGNRSEWTAGQLVTVDTQRPTVRLSLDSLAALHDDLLTSDDIVLDGEVSDDRQANGVDVCASAVEAPADEVACERHDVDPGTATVGTWRTSMPIHGTGDGAWQTLWFYGLDDAGNSSLPLTRTTRIDVVAPVVTVITQEVGTVLMLPTEILAGQVADGYAVDRIEVKLTKPGGSAEALELPIVNGAWSFTRQFDTTGDYSLSLDAWDIAGNQQHLGPFKFTVLGGDLVADTSVAIVPFSDPAITGDTFVYTTTVTNGGPGTATDTRLSLTAPEAAPIVSVSGGMCLATGNSATCDLGDLPSGTTYDVVLVVDVPLTTTGKLLFGVEVASDKIDFREGNNSLDRYINTYQPVSGLSLAGSLPTPLGDITAITATTATGTDVLFTVDFDDGITAEGIPITHTYGTVGRYTAVVVATNAVNSITGTTWIPVDIPVARPILQQGFEETGAFPPAGWLFQRTESASDDIAWQSTEQRAHSGSGSTYHDDLFGWYDSWLVAPQVTPTVGSELAFWQLVRYTDRLEGHSIWISTGRGDPKYGDFVKLADVPPDDDDTWSEQRLSLDAYTGQPIYIAFRYEGDFATEWYVDDVVMTAPLLAFNDGPTPIGATTHFTAVVGAGTNMSIRWDFGDGSSGVGLVPAHIYVLPGTYHVTVTAQNAVSTISAETIVVVEGPVFKQYLPLALSNYVAPCCDVFEPDDTQESASPIVTDGSPQGHSIHVAGDVDWITFDVDDIDAVYTIETFDLEHADTVIYLYDTNGVSLLDWNDDRESGDSSSILTFHPYHTGVFTLRIVDYYPDAGGCDHLYHVRVTR